MMLPTGAVNVNKVVVDDTCQNDAKDMGGGEQSTTAGFATLTVESENSMFGELLNPTQSTLQVAALPCEPGGVHTATRLTFTEDAKLTTKVLPSVHMFPAAANKLLGVIAVAVALVETKRNRCESITLEWNWGGAMERADVELPLTGPKRFFLPFLPIWIGKDSKDSKRLIYQHTEPQATMAKHTMLAENRRT